MFPDIGSQYRPVCARRQCRELLVGAQVRHSERQRACFLALTALTICGSPGGSGRRGQLISCTPVTCQAQVETTRSSCWRFLWIPTKRLCCSPGRERAERLTLEGRAGRDHERSFTRHNVRGRVEVPSGLYRQNLTEFLKEQALWPTEVSQENGGTFPPKTWFLRKGHLCRVCVSRRAGLALKTVMGVPLRTIFPLFLRLSLGASVDPLECWGIRWCRGGAAAGMGQLRGRGICGGGAAAGAGQVGGKGSTSAQWILEPGLGSDWRRYFGAD